MILAKETHMNDSHFDLFCGAVFGFCGCAFTCAILFMMAPYL